MADTQIHTCSDCAVLSCKAKDEAHYPAFCLTAKQNQARLEEALKVYQEDPEQGNIARVSAGIEGEFYGRLTRVEETIEFIRRMGYQKIGIASCVGLMPETRIYTVMKLTQDGWDVYAACAPSAASWVPWIKPSSASPTRRN